MLGFFTWKIFKVWLVVLNVVQILKSVDAGLPQCNLIRDVLFINVLKTKVTNVSRYFCEYARTDYFAAKLRDKVLNNESDTSLEEEDGRIMCRYNFPSIFLNFKSPSNETYIYPSDVDSVAITEIVNRSISLPRAIGPRVFFKETFAYDSLIFSQNILYSNASGLYFKTLKLNAFTGAPVTSLNLSIAPGSTQDANLVFVPITDFLNPNKIFVFFATLRDQIIRYATVEQPNCAQEKFISADDAPTLSQLQVFSKIGSNFRCADYSTLFTVEGDDTCPENPNNTLDFKYGYSKKVIKAFYSTWRTFVCYKIVDSSNFNNFRALL